jgi:hypothetical protein
MNKNNRVALVVSSLILALTATLLWFKITLNSDSLFLDGVAKDLFEHSGRWSDWRFSPAPAYIPDMLLYFFAYKVLPNAVDRIFFVSVAQVFILALVVTWTSKQIYPKISNAGLAALLLLIAFITFVASQSGLWLYFYTTDNHFASIVIPLICLGLIIRFYIKPSIISVGLLIVAGAFAKASTAIYIVNFLVPTIVLTLLVLTVAVKSLRHHRVHLSRVYCILGILVASFAMSYPLEAMLTFNNPLDGRLPFSFRAAGRSSFLLVKATIDAFTFGNKSTFFLSLLIFTSLLFVVHRFFSGVKCKENGVFITLGGNDEVTEDSWKMAACGALLVTVIPINIFGVVLSGGFVDPFGYRYFSFPIALTLILTVLIADKNGIFSSRQWRLGFVALSIMLIGFSIQVIRTNTPVTSQDQPIASCLIDIEKGGFNLKEGVADYWNARGISEFLPNKNWIVTTTNDLNPHFYMSSIGPIRRLDKYQYTYNFAILDAIDNADPFNYTSSTIGKLLPPPDRIEKCATAKAEIWLYYDGKLNSVIEGAFSRFLFNRKMGNVYHIEGKFLPGNTGNIAGLTRKAESSKDKPEFLTLGPYIDLDKGKYRISVKYSTTGPMKSTVGYVDMGQFSTPDPNSFYKQSLQANAAGSLTTLIDIPANGISKFEIRTWFSGIGSIEVEHLTISKVK